MNRNAIAILIATALALVNLWLAAYALDSRDAWKAEAERYAAACELWQAEAAFLAIERDLENPR